MKNDKEVVEVLARRLDPETWAVIDSQIRRGIPSSHLMQIEKKDSLNRVLRTLNAIAQAGLEITPGWSSDMKAAPRGTPIQLLHESGELYVNSINSDREAGYYAYWKPLGPLPPVEKPNQESDDG